MTTIPLEVSKPPMELLPSQGVLPVVIDTDAGNQIDDQFALTYALLHQDRLDIQAIYAAPFSGRHHLSAAEGMKASYEESDLIVRKFGMKNFTAIYHGSKEYLAMNHQPGPSEAVLDLIRRAAAHGPDNPLYVLSLGACTNTAIALKIEPRLAQRIVVVWLAGQPHEAQSLREFNLMGDTGATKLLFKSDVPLVRIPCNEVAESLSVNYQTIETHFKGRGAIGDYLYEIYTKLLGTSDRPKQLWDLAPIAWLARQDLFESQLIHKPQFDLAGWRFNETGKPMRIVTKMDGAAVLDDFFWRMGAQFD